MNFRHSILAMCCAGALAASAIPALPGAKNTFTQPDGTTISLSVVGDEFHHYYVTEDNKIVIATDGAYYYANVDANGRLANTGTLAHEMSMRSADERQMLDGINSEKVRSAIMQPVNTRSNAQSHDGQGLFSTSKFPTTGEVKALAFLVEFSDVSFTPGAPDYFKEMINQENYSENGATGSCRDYYVENSCGRFLPQFDVYGPVTLPNNRAWYGGNNANGNDSRPEYMMLHAAQALNSEVDFSQYDTDGDGYVDNVFIFYAGMSEAAGGGEDCIWPHSWEYTFIQKFDGVKFRKYACGSELITATRLDGIGTFCHEFGHVLGLPDLYNTVDASVNYTPLTWDLMDQGCYNNNSRTPPYLSAYERNALGWMGDNLIEITGPCSVKMDNMSSCNSAFVISTDKSTEFFILENRQAKGYDKNIPYHGMLIWHIDYNKVQFNNNTVNNNPDHQYVDLVEACGTTFSSKTSQRHYPFPGYGKVTSFVFGGNPSFQSWSGADLGLDITNIKEIGGVITFDVAGGGDMIAGLNTISNKATDYTVDNRCISVETSGNISVTDMTGRIVASGINHLTTNQLTPGIYILITQNSRSKVLIK